LLGHHLDSLNGSSGVGQFGRISHIVGLGRNSDIGCLAIPLLKFLIPVLGFGESSPTPFLILAMNAWFTAFG
jgi:hypothetical protein